MLDFLEYHPSAGEVNFENETSRNESNVRIELDADSGIGEKLSAWLIW